MASSLILKKKLNLLTGFPFRHVSATNCLTSSSDTFRQRTASNRFTRSSFPDSNATVSNFLTSSAVIFRQAASSNRLTTSAAHFRPISSLRTSVLLTRSTVPLRQTSEVTEALISRFIYRKEFHVNVSSGRDSVVFRQDAASNSLTTSPAHFRPALSFCSSILLTRSIIPFRRPSGALISPHIYYKEFHVDVSGHDSAVVRFMKRLRDKLDPFGWWYLVFKFDEDNLLQVATEKKLFRIGWQKTDEGVSIHMQMPGVEYRDMKVSVEDNSLFCKGITAHDLTHEFEFELPEKTYQASDVKGKLQNGVLWVTITNLKKEDVKQLKIRYEWY